MLNTTLLTPYRKLSLAALIAIAAGGAPASTHARSHDHQPAQAEQDITIGATKLNDTLTMLSGVVLPLSLIAAFYGMNVEALPFAEKAAMLSERPAYSSMTSRIVAKNTSSPSTQRRLCTIHDRT